MSVLKPLYYTKVWKWKARVQQEIKTFLWKVHMSCSFIVVHFPQSYGKGNPNAQMPYLYTGHYLLL